MRSKFSLNTTHYQVLKFENLPTRLDVIGAFGKRSPEYGLRQRSEGDVRDYLIATHRGNIGFLGIAFTPSSDAASIRMLFEMPGDRPNTQDVVRAMVLRAGIIALRRRFKRDQGPQLQLSVEENDEATRRSLEMMGCVSNDNMRYSIAHAGNLVLPQILK